jgi:hypothetical protein
MEITAVAVISFLSGGFLTSLVLFLIKCDFKVMKLVSDNITPE